MQTDIIEKELKKYYNVVALPDKKEEPLQRIDFNKIPFDKIKIERISNYEFPIKFIPERIKPIIKFPLRLGELVWRTGKEIVK